MAMDMEQITAVQHVNKVANGEKVSDRHLASQPCDQKNNYGNRGLLALRRCNRKNNHRKCDGDDDGSNNNSNMEKENSASRSISSTAGLSMLSWSDLPLDLIERIMEKITYHVDLYHFGVVCKPWHSALIDNCRRLPRSLPLCHCPPGQRSLPLLMKVCKGDSDSQEFLCLSDGKVSGELFLPELKNKRIAGSSEGWLVLVDIIEDGICLFNPFTRAQIQLPQVTSFLPSINLLQPDDVYQGPFKTNEYIEKAILTSDPKLSGDNCTVVAIVSDDQLLSYCGLGDNKWTVMKNSPIHIEDIIYHKGHVYAVCHRGAVMYCDYIGVDAEMTVIGGRRTLDLLRRNLDISRRYLVESSGGELLLVERMTDCEEVKERVYNYKTLGFRVCKLEEGELNLQVYNTYRYNIVKELVRSEWVELDGIGGDMLFLGTNKSIATPAHLFPQCKGNCIYFSADPGSEIYYVRHFSPIPDELRHDIGIYDMEDGSIRYYDPNDPQFIMPPVWVTPNPW